MVTEALYAFAANIPTCRVGLEYSLLDNAIKIFIMNCLVVFGLIEN